MAYQSDALKDQFNQLSGEVNTARRDMFMAYIQQCFIAMPDSDEHREEKALVDECLQYIHANPKLTLMDTLLVAYTLNGGVILQDVMHGLPLALSPLALPPVHCEYETASENGRVTATTRLTLKHPPSLSSTSMTP